MAGLMYQGSELPENVRKAAQGVLDYQKAIKAKLPLAVEGSGIPDSVRKAAQGLLDYSKATKAKLPLGVEGSGLPDSVRKAAQAVLEKGASSPASTAASKVPLALQGSELPEGVRRAAQGALDVQKAANAKLPLAVEGSGIPDSVRKAAQAAIERGPSGGGASGGGGGLVGGGGTGAPVGEPGPNINPGSGGQVSAPAKGIMSSIGSGASKLLGRLNAAGMLYGAAESLKESRESDAAFAEKLFAERALANVPEGAPQDPPPQVAPQETPPGTTPQADPGFSAKESMSTQYTPNFSVEESMSTQMQPRPGFSADESMTTQMVPNPQAPQPPRGLVGQQAPQATPRAAPTELPPELAERIGGLQKAQQERQVEQTRQQLEAGTMKGLQTGETSVSQLAQGIVQADAQRSGNTTMTPEQTAKAVTAEVATLKSMEPSDMARYVSYALIAGGLLASVLDKSGRTAEAFATSLNKQLDRNLAAGKMQFDQRLAERKENREDRKVNNDEKDVNSKIDERAATQKNAIRGLDQGDTRLAQSQEEVGLRRQSIENDFKLGSQRNGIMAQGNAVSASNAATGHAIDRERIASQEGIASRKLAASSKNDKGVPLTYKDSKEVVDQVYSGAGQSVQTEVKNQIAARLPTLQKKYPELSPAELVRLAQSELKTETTPETFWSKPKVKQVKSVE